MAQQFSPISDEALDLTYPMDVEVAELGEDEEGGEKSQRFYEIFVNQGECGPLVTKRPIDEVEGTGETSPTKKVTIESGKSQPVQGESRSATFDRRQNAKFIEGAFNADDSANFTRFTTSIKQCDNHAVIFNSKTVRHFKCRKKLTMKAPYNTQAFKDHIKSCRGLLKSSKKAGGGMDLISTFFTAHTRAPSPIQQKSSLPCPGLDEVEYPQVGKYLGCTGALGGGAPSVTVIYQELFGKAFKNLPKLRKEHVQNAQKHDWVWRNDANSGKVFSLKCLKKSHPSSDGVKGPCTECHYLLQHKGFKNAIHIVCPPDKNFKYLNEQYRNKSLALIYGHTKGLWEILEDDVSGISSQMYIFLTHDLFRVPENHQ